MKHIHIGLKIWSSNGCYLNAIKALKREGYVDFVELFVEPRSGADHLRMWKGLEMPYLLHAPHSSQGLNFGVKGQEEQNRALIYKVKHFQDGLGARKIIFHPGTNGSLDESIRQINGFANEFSGIFKKVIIENKPKVGIGHEDCLGASFDEMKRIKNETGRGFCFDISHAMCFAAWAGRAWEGVLSEFLGLEPEVYHLCDGDRNSVYDSHQHLGEGNFDLKKIVSMIPDGSFVSIETAKSSTEHLDDFKRDVDYLRKCLLNGN